MRAVVTPPGNIVRAARGRPSPAFARNPDESRNSRPAAGVARLLNIQGLEN
jgi:hypothetical protein